jgi:hypothetical protein
MQKRKKSVKYAKVDDIWFKICIEVSI